MAVIDYSEYLVPVFHVGLTVWILDSGLRTPEVPEYLLFEANVDWNENS